MTSQAEKPIGTARLTLGTISKRVLGIATVIFAVAGVIGGECWVLEHGPTALGALQWGLATDLTPLLAQTEWHFSLQTAAVH